MIDLFGLREVVDWWAGLSPWWKAGAALLLLASSTVLWFLGQFWPWGWVAGVVLLLFSLPSPAQRKGYHDF